jgi:alpha-mannosidase
MNNINKSRSGRKISRRTFISRTSAGTAFLVMGPVTGILGNGMMQNDLWPPDAPKFRFHMIGNAHIDPVWLWPWSEGVAVVHSTFRSALDRMNESPDVTFTASSAQFYRWVAENDPEMLKEIRKRVDEGRWNIVGGWWVEPDMNIPSGESMARQGLYGQLTFGKLLGHRAVVATNPDSFGHAGTLPQIIKQQGMENYIFMRPSPYEKTLPADLFWWEAPDGTRVLTYRIQFSYTDEGPVRSRLRNIMTNFGNQPMKSFMAYYGAGDHGGGATKENMKSIDELKTEKGAPVVFYSTTDKYFREVKNDKSLNLPVVKDDLQHHSTGCYTAVSEIKKNNRLAEAALATAEKLAALGSMAWGAHYPKDELTSAWEKVLFLQFHDSMAGTSLPEHYQTAREGHGYALSTSNNATMMALQKLEWQVPAEDSSSEYLLLFNPHAWEVKENIEYDIDWNIRNPSHVEDEKGNPLLHQWTGGTTEAGSRKTLVVKTAIPAMGYRQIRIRNGDPLPAGDVVRAEGNILENGFLKVHFSKDGTIGIYDKESGKELFAGSESGCRAVVLDDPSDTWSHDVKSFSNEIGVFSNAEFSILENGPLRAAIRVRTSWGNSFLAIDWTLYSGSRELEAEVVLDWHEKMKMLKFSFPVDIESPEATYEVPFGHIIRAVNGNEEPGQRWIDLSGMRDGKAFGLAVINDAKYGYSVKDNDMRVSIVRSPVYAHHRPRVVDLRAEHNWMDQGIQTFRMLLVPHKGTWKESGIVRRAEEFVAGPVTIYQGIHRGSMPKSGTFLSVDVPNVIIPAIKMSESGNDLIIRCVETSGQETTATVDLHFAGKKWTGIFRPCEIKTLRVKKGSWEFKEVNLLEE